MGGVDGLFRRWQRSAEGVGIKDRAPCRLRNAKDDLVARPPKPHTADDDIGPLHESEDGLQVVRGDQVAIQTLVDQVGDRDAGGGGDPHDIRAGTQRPERRDIRRTLVGAAADDENLAAGALVGLLVSSRKEREVAGTGVDLGFKRDSYIHEICALDLWAVEREDPVCPYTGGGDIDGDDRRSARVRAGNQGCKRFTRRTGGACAEHRIDDDICPIKPQSG